jgi:uncharacterized protein
MESITEVSVVGLIMDPVSKSPVMILKPLNDRKIIPIWIGSAEANAIALELESVVSPRPMTHDLITAIIGNLHAKVNKVVITGIVENTYYAQLYLKTSEQTSVIDCRPSDAVAMALRNQAKIFVSTQVLETSMVADVFSNLLDSEEKIDRWFESLTPDDFGSVEQ